MLVFIDDSGDPGFKFEKGSTRYFVVLLLIFDDELEAEKAVTAIRALKKYLGFPEGSEFKFHRSSRKTRIKFLEAINSYKFRIEALVIDKARIKNPPLASHGNSFYGYTMQTALEYATASISDAKIWIDGSGDEAFKKTFTANLRKKLNTKQRKVIKHCKIINSKGNELIQMADMIAGAVRRSYDVSKRDAALYKSIIKKHIEHEWRLDK